MVDTGSIIAVTLVAAAIAAAAQYLFKSSVTEFKMNLSGIWKVMTKRNMVIGLTMYLASRMGKGSKNILFICKKRGQPRQRP